MCGRYASSRSPDDLAEEFEVVDPRLDQALPADYNVAPTKEVYAVLDRAPRPTTRRAVRRTPIRVRQLRVLRWGLVPFWAKDPSIGSRMINARMETVAEKPAFRRAFAGRRCLLPADGYFEWYETQHEGQGGQAAEATVLHQAEGRVGAGDGRALRDLEGPDPRRRRSGEVPLDLHRADHRGHRRGGSDPRPDAAARHAATAVRPGSTRRRPKDQLPDLLVPAQQSGLEAFPVSTAVGNVRNNGPELVEPIPFEESLL